MEEAAEAVATLVSSGVLAEQDGRWTASPSPMRTALQIHSTALANDAKRLHTSQLEHAAVALHELGGEHRYVASMCVPVRAGALEELVASVQRTHLAMVEPYRSEDPAGLIEVVVAVFPRTKPA